MKEFKIRNFVSLFIAWTGLISIISGIILYLAPPGRVAFWVDWHLFGLTKKQWEAVHTITSFFLAIFIIWHLILNWKPFVAYMRDKVKKINFTVPEFLWSLIFTVVLTVMSIYSIPPVSYIMDFGDYLTASWERGKKSPVIPHAERLTLKDYCEKINFPLEKAIKRLKVMGLKEVSSDKTLEEIAETNKLAPSDVADMLNFKQQGDIKGEKTQGNEKSQKKSSIDGVRGNGFSGKQGERHFGNGNLNYIGRMTVEEFCGKTGINFSEVKAFLKKKGIENVNEGEKLRDIARENGLIPRKLREILLELIDKKGKKDLKP